MKTLFVSLMAVSLLVSARAFGESTYMGSAMGGRMMGERMGSPMGEGRTVEAREGRRTMGMHMDRDRDRHEGRSHQMMAEGDDAY